MSIENLLSRLQGVKKTGDGKWMAKCSSHVDKNPSLAIKENPDGIVLVHCFAGCSAEDVVNAVGMELKDLMPDNVGFHRKSPDPRPFNPYDVLAAVRSDMTNALVYCKDMQDGKVPSETESLHLAMIVGRITMAIQLAGGRD